MVNKFTHMIETLLEILIKIKIEENNSRFHNININIKKYLRVNSWLEVRHLLMEKNAVLM